MAGTTVPRGSDFFVVGLGKTGFFVTVAVLGVVGYLLLRAHGGGM
jgi:hypothetical protein